MNKTAAAIAPRHAAAELAQPFPPLILARLPHSRVLAMADPSDPRQKRRLSPVRQLAMALPAGSSLRPRRARRTPRLLSASLLSRPGQGSALVQALMILSVAVIAALALSTRLLAARGGSFSRSDTLAAREAAEYGLNEIQSQLNTSQFGYLWVTKWDSANNRWRSVTSTDLTNCSLSARDSSGNVIANPGLPAGVTSTKTIRNDSGVTVQYRVTNFEPPNLPDNNTATKDQAAYCNPVTAAANFGNLNGGSARITVEGIVTRGSGANAVTSRFRLRRQSHVQPPSASRPLNFPSSFWGTHIRPPLRLALYLGTLPTLRSSTILPTTSASAPSRTPPARKPRTRGAQGSAAST